MTLRNYYIVTAGILLALFFMSVFTIGRVVFAGVTYSNPTLKETYLNHTFFTATTTTATSTNESLVPNRTLRIGGAKQVVFYFSRGDTKGTGNAGSTNFKVETSRDGTNWDSYNTLLQNVATSTTPTSLSSITISAATSTVTAYMQYLGFKEVRCIAVETTDGESSCVAAATY